MNLIYREISTIQTPCAVQNIFCNANGSKKGSLRRFPFYVVRIYLKRHFMCMDLFKRECRIIFHDLSGCLFVKSEDMIQNA